MVNVGLRAFIWENKDIEHKLAREVWTLNGTSYWGYREYVAHCKDHGFPEQQAMRLPRRTTGGSSAVETSQTQPAAKAVVRLQASGSSATSGAGAAAGFQFTGMHPLTDNGGQRITVLAFGRLTSSLLAYGSLCGAVSVVKVGDTPVVEQVLQGHELAVNDLDWSLDNTFLLSAGLDGCACMWLAASRQLLRTFRARAMIVCARFHLVNQNLVIAGTNAGTVEVFNSSTGKLAKRLALQSGGFSGSVSCCAMAASNTLLFVADSQAVITTLRCDIKGGVLQRLVILSRHQPAGGRPAEVASLHYQPYSGLVHGAALLCSVADGTVCVLRAPDAAAGKLEVAASARMPPAARSIRAAFCPPSRPGAPECIVMGGEDAHVYMYNITNRKRGPVVVTQLQGHLAPVLDVAWSFDGSFLASCDCDGVVLIWRRARSRLD